MLALVIQPEKVIQQPEKLASSHKNLKKKRQNIELLWGKFSEVKDNSEKEDFAFQPLFHQNLCNVQWENPSLLPLLNCLQLYALQKVSTYSGSSLKSEPDFSTVKKKEKKKKKKPPPSVACMSLRDKDLSFMINLGRFKYLLSQGFQVGEGSQIQSKSCHQPTSGQCRANFLILAK